MLTVELKVQLIICHFAVQLPSDEYKALIISTLSEHGFLATANSQTVEACLQRKLFRQLHVVDSRNLLTSKALQRLVEL
jgi:hypothetical protein